MTCLSILAVTSTTKREGKTTLLEITTATCAKPLPTTNISSAALFRSIEGWGPTLICDEMDKQFKKNDDLRTLFNAGHTRATAFVIRVVGDKLEPRAFNIFGPKAVGLIGKLPSTMQDRSIEIRMRRKTQGQQISRIMRNRLEKECAALRSQIVRWLEDNKERISEETATPPLELDDRAADNWRGLFALASAVGGPWPERTKGAALRLSEIRKEDVDFGEELLGDLQQIFGEQVRMFTSDILTKLNELDDRPWPTALRGKPINAHWLARKLKPFNIKPRDIRYGDIVLKGYFREGPMEDAFKTYLTPPNLIATPLHSEENQEDTEQSNRYKEDVCSGYDGQLTMQEESFRSDVADKIGGVEGEGDIKAESGEAEDMVWEHFQREQRERIESEEPEMTADEARIWEEYFQ